MMFQRQLTILLLLLTVLLTPLTSLAHEEKAGTAKSPCACHLADPGAGDSGSKPGQPFGGSSDHSCECEVCCPDATEPALFCGLNLNFSVQLHLHSHPSSYLPKVILTIFVPPQSSSLA